jgi:hypothetical protein
MVKQLTSWFVVRKTHRSQHLIAKQITQLDHLRLQISRRQDVLKVWPKNFPPSFWHIHEVW